MFVYGSTEDHMFDFLTGFFLYLTGNFLYALKMRLLRMNRQISNLPKYSFRNEPQLHIWELSGRARKTLRSAGESGEVASDSARGSFKELFPLTIRD